MHLNSEELDVLRITVELLSRRIDLLERRLNERDRASVGRPIQYRARRVSYDTSPLPEEPF